MAGIKDIAEKAGVSIGTVDRVLHNRGRFAEKTREKVLAIAKELNYQPNLNARRLKRKEPCKILVLMAELHQDQGFWKVSLKGIEKAKAELASIGVDVVLKTYDRYDQASFWAAASAIGDKEVKGVVLAPLRPTDSQKLMASHPDVPFAIFDCPCPEANPWSSTLQDPYLGGQTVARILSLMLRVGDKVAVISYDSPNPHMELRVKGFGDMLESLGLSRPDHRVIPDELNFEELSQEVQNKQYQLDQYRAIFVAKTGVYKYAKLFKAKRPILVGYDLVDENIQALKNSEIDFLISQNSSAQTYESIKNLANYVLDGQTLAQTEMPMPVDILTRDNIDLYLKYH